MSFRINTIFPSYNFNSYSRHALGVGDGGVTRWRLTGDSFPKVGQSQSLTGSEILPLDVYFWDHEGLFFVKKNLLKKYKYSWTGDSLTLHYILIWPLTESVLDMLILSFTLSFQ